MKRLTLNNTLNLILLTIYFIPVTYAAPILVDINYFSGSETVLTFDELIDDQFITTQYLSSGIEFINNPDITASTSNDQQFEVWDVFTNPGNAVLQNFSNETLANSETPAPVTIDFLLSPQLIGFDVISDSGGAIYSITSALSGEVTAFQLETYIPERFIAFYDPDGISSLEIDGNADFIGVGVIGINDLRFETVTAVPLPPSFLLFLSGLIIIYRRKHIT